MITSRDRSGDGGRCREEALIFALFLLRVAKEITRVKKSKASAVNIDGGGEDRRQLILFLILPLMDPRNSY